MTHTIPDPEVAAVLAESHLDYTKLLERAWHWNRTGRTPDLKKAEELLTELTRPEQFAFVLPVWYERAFNLVRQKRPDEAVVLLKQIDRDFSRKLDEDTLSLWARIDKDRGDAALAAGRLDVAEQEYTRSEELYARAYALRKDRFPGINLATLRFVRAGLRRAIADRAFADGAEAAGLDPATAGRAEADALVKRSRELAGELVAASGSWREVLPDDKIWMRATLAEAYVLLGRWDDARAEYAAALSPKLQPQPFHAESMKAQLARLFAAYVRLGDQSRDPDAFIPSPGPAAGAAVTREETVVYVPKPIDTTAVRLDPDLLKLTEQLAEHAHDVWAAERLANGWVFGPTRDDAAKTHPCLIPYADLPESEKQYDRNAALETLKAVIALRYEVKPKPE